MASGEVARNPRYAACGGRGLSVCNHSSSSAPDQSRTSLLSSAASKMPMRAGYEEQMRPLHDHIASVPIMHCLRGQALLSSSRETAMCSLQDMLNIATGH
jgi:hypothetical protein